LNALPQSGEPQPAVLVALKGTLPSPKRSVDTNLLMSWLTLRAVERQSKQLDAIERAAREAAAAAAAAQTPAKPAEGNQQTPDGSSPSLAPAAPGGEASGENRPAPLPAPITVPAAPKPRPAPRIDGAPPRSSTNPGLLGAQN